MIIKKIMFSGPKENNRPEDLISFIKSDEKIEMGVYFTQYSAKGNSRYDWIKDFSAKMAENNFNATLQIGYEWCEDFCNGKIADEVAEMLSIENQNGRKVFNSIQLNFLLNQQNLDKERLIEVIKSHPAHRFVLSYNTMNKDFIDSMTFKGVPFDVLYKPFTEVESMQNNKDFFLSRMQGYSGDFQASNIGHQLDKIAAISHPNAKTYIDLYKVLFDENGDFSIDIATNFRNNINSWIENRNIKKQSA